MVVTTRAAIHPMGNYGYRLVTKGCCMRNYAYRLVTKGCCIPHEESVYRLVLSLVLRGYSA